MPHHILACDLMLLSRFSEEAAFVAREGDLHEDFNELRRHRGVARHVTQGFWVALHVSMALGLLGFSLGMGMLLGGMGPVNPPVTFGFHVNDKP